MYKYLDKSLAGWVIAPSDLTVITHSSSSYSLLRFPLDIRVDPSGGSAGTRSACTADPNNPRSASEDGPRCRCSPPSKYSDSFANLYFSDDGSHRFVTYLPWPAPVVDVQ